MISVQFGFAAAAACDWKRGRTTMAPTPMSATIMVTEKPMSINGEKRLLRLLFTEFLNIFDGSRGFVNIFSINPFRLLCNVCMYLCGVPKGWCRCGYNMDANGMVAVGLVIIT